jgi:acyl-ACP thioesterase
MAIAHNFTSILQKEWEINFTLCDPSGKLKYPDLCNLLQLTAAEHAEMGGISFTDMQTNNQAWVLSRMRVEIDDMPRWKQKITIKTWIVSLENSRSIRAMEVYLNDKKIIGVESFWAVFNTQTRRPENLALPHEHFEKFAHKRGTALPFAKIEIPTATEFVKTKKVQWSDLDIVNHVNNVKYLEWCLDAQSEQCSKSSGIRVLEMNFLSELNLHDEVHILVDTSNQNQQTFSVVKDQKVCYLAQVDWK